MYDHKTAEDVELIKVSITAILDLRLAQSYIYVYHFGTYLSIVALVAVHVAVA